MRVTVNLSIFFHDHRSLAKIFLSKNLKTIKDVEKHISDIFNIHNFYLKCENQYLPPIEDVQVLNKDDIVWAIPKNEAVLHPNNCLELPQATTKMNKTFNLDSNVSEEKTKMSVKTKKRKESKPECEIVNNASEEDQKQSPTVAVVNGDNSSSEKKKRKSKKVDTSHILNESPSNIEEVNGIKKKKVKKAADADATSNSENSDKMDCSSQSVPNKRRSESMELQPETNTNYVNTIKRMKQATTSTLLPNNILNSGHKSDLITQLKNVSYRNSPKILPIMPLDNEKRINIVKTIIISNKTSESKNNKSNTSESGNSENNTAANNTTKGDAEITNFASNAMNVSEATNCSNTDVVSTEKQTLPLDAGDNDLPSPIHCEMQFQFPTPNTLSMSNGHSTDTSDVSLQKRKRKRTHRRRRDVRSDTSVDNDCTYLKPSVLLATSNPSHKRFDVQEEEIIEINESSNVGTASEIISLTKSFTEPEVNPEDLDECILKQPILQNMDPKVDDIISFKILRMSENYTPEVSKHIIGKVVNFWPENKDITMQILHGQDQCLQPQGKFSLDSVEPEVEIVNTNNFHSTWSNLFEPRLLFP